MRGCVLYFMTARGTEEVVCQGNLHKMINTSYLYLRRVFSLFFYSAKWEAYRNTVLSMNSSIYKTSMLETQRKEYIGCKYMFSHG